MSRDPHYLIFNHFKISDHYFSSYNDTVDYYFSTLEANKQTDKVDHQVSAAQNRLDAAKADQQKRLIGLEEVELFNTKKALAIEKNLELVNQTTLAVNTLLAQGMDWGDISKLITIEKENENRVAQSISNLNLGANQILMTLHIENETGGSEHLVVPIDLSLSAWQNACEFYDRRKAAAEKRERTMLSGKKAIKSTERKVARDLGKRASGRKKKSCTH